jgi:hypothetical protein
MTGPIEGSTPGSDEDSAAPQPVETAGPEPAEPAEPADAVSPPPDVGAGETPPPVPHAPTGWVAEGPESGRRTRGCVIAAVVVVVALFVGFVGLVFLGTQIQSMLAGTIEFGTGGQECSVSDRATTFPASATIHYAAHLQREMRGGEKITITVTFPNGTTDSTDETFDKAGQCVYQDIDPGLDVGHYVMEFRSGTELLSKGEFDITP